MPPSHHRGPPESAPKRRAPGRRLCVRRRPAWSKPARRPSPPGPRSACAMPRRRSPWTGAPTRATSPTPVEAAPPTPGRRRAAADEGTRQRSPGATFAQQPERPCSRPAPAPPAWARSAPPGSGVLHGWRWRANHAAIRVARAADPQGSGRDGPLGVRLHRARGLRRALRERARHALHRGLRVRRASDWAGAPLVAKRNPLRHRQKSAFAKRLSDRSNPSLVFLRLCYGLLSIYGSAQVSDG